MKGAQKVCINVGAAGIQDDKQQGALLMFTEFNTSEYRNTKDYADERYKSEKTAAILTSVIFGTLAFMAGYVVRMVHKEN